MKPYSMDLREKILQACRNHEGSFRALAKRFSVSLNFVWLLWKRYLETGAATPKPHGGGVPSVMTPERLSELRQLVDEQNDATVKELQERFHAKIGIVVSRGTISRALKKLKLSRKKKTFHATERDTAPDVVSEREEYIEQMPRMDVQRLVFVDEFGVNLSMAREYGRAPIGTRAKGRRPYRPGENITVLGGLSCQKIMAPFVFANGVNGDIFKAYLEKFLVPSLSPGDIVLMDNLRAHKVHGVEEILENAEVKLVYLPRYSPDLSPFENAVSKIKGQLRTTAARSYDALLEAVNKAFDNVSSSDAGGWFMHCGYSIESG